MPKLSYCVKNNLNQNSLITIAWKVSGLQERNRWNPVLQEKIWLCRKEPDFRKEIRH
jgi:hypothetical protein